MAGRPLLVVAVLALLCDGFNGTRSRSPRDLTSPDTRCALRLDRLAELGADWMLQLPELGRRASVARPQRAPSMYVQRVARYR